MKPNSVAHAQLIEMTRQRGEKLRLSRVLDVQPNQMTQWVDGGIKPAGKNRTKLEIHLGIRSTDWDRPAEEISNG